MKLTGVLESIICGDTTFNCVLGTAGTTARPLLFTLRAAAIDTTDDSTVNYDTLVFFDASGGEGREPGPFALPATGPAYAKVGGPSARFFFADG